MDKCDSYDFREKLPPMQHQDDNLIAPVDAVAPRHYTKHAIQPIVFIMGNDLPFAEGCIVKYVSRWRDRGGVEDLQKARAYLDFLIKQHKTGTPL